MDRSLLNAFELREFASDCERLDVCGPEGGVFEAEWVRKALERRQVRATLAAANAAYERGNYEQADRYSEAAAALARKVADT